MKDVNEPVVPVATTFVFEVVGLEVVAYTTPLSVMAAPPSEVTFPPDDALVAVILVADAVVTVGNASVVNEISLP
jgi:hypothetical protein